MASMVKSSVITLVTLDGSSASCSFWAYSTCPVSFSISSAASARIGSSTAPACTGVSASTSRSAAHKPAIRLICSPPFRFVSSICGGEIFMPPSTKFPVAKPGDICYNEQVFKMQG